MLGMGLRLSIWSLTGCLETISIRMSKDKILKAQYFYFCFLGKYKQVC